MYFKISLTHCFKISKQSHFRVLYLGSHNFVKAFSISIWPLVMILLLWEHLSLKFYNTTEDDILTTILAISY